MGDKKTLRFSSNTPSAISKFKSIFDKRLSIVISAASEQDIILIHAHHDVNTFELLLARIHIGQVLNSTGK